MFADYIIIFMIGYNFYQAIIVKKKKKINFFKYICMY
jgi:hypothetical protein